MDGIILGDTLPRSHQYPDGHKSSLVVKGVPRYLCKHTHESDQGTQEATNRSSYQRLQGQSRVNPSVAQQTSE